MAADMLRCEQTQGQSVYQHGLSVRKHFFELIDHLQNGHPLEGWRVPKWLEEYGPEIIKNLHDMETISNYTLYHDCGKPYCRTVDADGRVHFPNHAEVSRDVWMNVGKSKVVGHLIANDMVIHTATAEEITYKITSDECAECDGTGLSDEPLYCGGEYNGMANCVHCDRGYTRKAEWSKQDALTLLLAALAEIHSNAKMFGGIESSSFKSKWKKIDRRGNQICKHYFEGGKS